MIPYILDIVILPPLIKENVSVVLLLHSQIKTIPNPLIFSEIICTELFTLTHFSLLISATKN